MCITQQATDDCRTASIASTLAKPSTSLIMSAPRSITARMTSGFRVSTDRGTPHSRKAFSTGCRRPNSASTGTTAAPGRVDSAPRSRRSAPSSIMRWAASMAADGSSHCPPSEKESGVRLRIPITNGRSSDNSKRPHRRNVAGRPNRSGRPCAVSGVRFGSPKTY